MKFLLRTLAAVLFGLFGQSALAGNLKVNLSPAQAVTAGAQWRVDGGTWRNSGATVSGLSNTTHAVDYKAVTGWVTPAATNVTITSGTTTLNATPYVQTASLRITLTPSSGQWRIDGGTWRTSGTTVTGLTPGAHTVDYSSVAGYQSPATESVTLVSAQTTTLTRSYTALAGLKITLAPTSGQWRVDGGAWRTSGTTVSNLTPGSHTVDYAALNNYAAPTSESVTLVSGQTTNLTRNYTALAQLTVTLAPASGQWRVDGGAWQASGATVTNLAVGSHTITYNALAGYSAPATESVTLASGQSLSFSRSYIQLAQVTITLTPAGAQWQIDGGAWNASGATVANLAPGSHTIAYSTVAGYITPASEAVTLAAGQSLPLSRNYVQLAGLTIALSPSQGQWRVDGGAWQASGATVSNLTPGAHTVDYSTLTHWGTPSSESVTLASGQTLSLSRSYTTLYQTMIALVPASGQWRINGGAWLASGISVYLPAGTHTIEYSSLALYDSPPTETVTNGLIATRSYVSQKPTLRVNLTPAGQWRLDGGTWQASGALLSELATGSHTIDYLDVGGAFDPLPSETVTLALHDNITLSRTYPFKKIDVTVTLDPPTGTWRADSSEWMASGATLAVLPGNRQIQYGGVANYNSPPAETVTIAPGSAPVSLARAYTPHPAHLYVETNIGGGWRAYLQGGSPGATWENSGTVLTLPHGTYVIEFQPMPTWIAPATETIVIGPGDYPQLTRSYTPAPGAMTVSLSPTTGQWRVDGSAWLSDGATVSNLAPGNHTVEYAAVAGYVTPATETITILQGQTANLYRSYLQLAQLTVTLAPASARWRVDGGIWQASGATVVNLALGSHAIDYEPLAGYVTPVSESVTLGAAQSLSLERYYLQMAQLTVNVTPANAQWRLDGGAWQASGATVTSIVPGNHTISYDFVAGYAPQASESVSLSGGQALTLTRAYAGIAQLMVTLTPSTAQWRLDGGAWQTSGYTISNIPVGSHTIDYSPLSGYAAPASESIALSAGQFAQLSRSYTQFASLLVTLNPAEAQWRVDGGAWQASGATVATLAPGNHTVDYGPVPGYQAPPSETVTLTAGQSATRSWSYLKLATVTVTLTPSSGQWRINSGTWQASGTTLIDVPPGTHLLSFSPVAGYATPPTEALTLATGSVVNLARTYSSVGEISVSLTPAGAQWNLDGGPWLSSGHVATNVPTGSHTIGYSFVSGYVSPATETVTLASGQSLTLTRDYVRVTTLKITTTPIDPSWRVDGGIWRDSGSTFTGIAAGPHTIEYQQVPTHIAPATETLTLAPGDQLVLTRVYTPLTQISMWLSPSTGRWRVDGGDWLVAGFFVTPAGQHTIDFEPLPGLVTPASQTVTVVQDQTLYLSGNYLEFARLTINLNAPGAQWRVDGGAWLNSGATASNLTGGSHYLEYSAVAGYSTPPPQTIILLDGQTAGWTTFYTQLAALTVNLTAPGAQWRLDGGPWQNSGATLTSIDHNVSHTIDYSDVIGYFTPSHPEVIGPYSLLQSGQTTVLTRFYSPMAALTVNLTAPGAQWRLDGGAWQNSGATVANIDQNVSHTVDYSDVTGYFTPSHPELIGPYNLLQGGQTTTLTRFYTQMAALTVNLNAPGAQWRLDGGAWQNSGATVANIDQNVSHVLDYSDVTGYFTPSHPELIGPYNQLQSGQTTILTRFYTAMAALTVNLNAPGAQWRIDGGAWQNSGATVANIDQNVSHVLDYSDVPGYETPSHPELIGPYNLLQSGQTTVLSRFYFELATLTVTLNVPGGQWRLDGGAWQNSGATLANIVPDEHTIEYRGTPGYIAPQPYSTYLNYGEDRQLSAFYFSLGTHRLRFFLHQDLVGSLSATALQNRISQYVTHLKQVHDRETFQIINFDPATDISVVTASPFDGGDEINQMHSGFEMWVYAALTDNPAVGTYGGSLGFDTSGAGGANGLKWDQIHDPSALIDGSPALAQYWTQLHSILKQFERIYDVSHVDYDSVAGLKDLSGVAPILPDVASATSAVPDAFWNARFDYWSDPLTANAYGNPRLGSPVSLGTLLNIVSFAPVSRAFINQSWRYYPYLGIEPVANLSSISIKVIDAQTGAPIPNATVRIWNRQSPTPPATTYEETVSAGSPGFFNFAWTGAAAPFSENSNAKLIKAFAPGYASTAQWYTVFDAQTELMVNLNYSLQITIALTHQ